MVPISANVAGRRAILGAREILAARARLNEIYVEHTGQQLAVIESTVERDHYMTPTEAEEFGLIDEVVVSRPPKDDDDEEAEGGQKD